jgi:hypothetical protein
MILSASGEKNAYKVLVGKPDGKIPVGIPRCRWVENIKMDFGYIRGGGMDWIGLARCRDK